MTYPTTDPNAAPLPAAVPPPAPVPPVTPPAPDYDGYVTLKDTASGQTYKVGYKGAPPTSDELSEIAEGLPAPPKVVAPVGGGLSPLSGTPPKPAAPNSAPKTSLAPTLQWQPGQPLNDDAYAQMRDSGQLLTDPKAFIAVNKALASGAIKPYQRPATAVSPYGPSDTSIAGVGYNGGSADYLAVPDQQDNQLRLAFPGDTQRRDYIRNFLAPNGLTLDAGNRPVPADLASSMDRISDAIDPINAAVYGGFDPAARFAAAAVADKAGDTQSAVDIMKHQGAYADTGTFLPGAGAPPPSSTTWNPTAQQSFGTAALNNTVPTVGGHVISQAANPLFQRLAVAANTARTGETVGGMEDLNPWYHVAVGAATLGSFIFGSDITKAAGDALNKVVFSPEFNQAMTQSDQQAQQAHPVASFAGGLAPLVGVAGGLNTAQVAGAGRALAAVAKGAKIADVLATADGQTLLQAKNALMMNAGLNMGVNAAAGALQGKPPTLEGALKDAGMGLLPLGEGEAGETSDTTQPNPADATAPATPAKTAQPGDLLGYDPQGRAVHMVDPGTNGSPVAVHVDGTGVYAIKADRAPEILSRLSPTTPTPAAAPAEAPYGYIPNVLNGGELPVRFLGTVHGSPNGLTETVQIGDHVEQMSPERAQLLRGKMRPTTPAEAPTIAPQPPADAGGTITPPTATTAPAEEPALPVEATHPDGTPKIFPEAQLTPEGEAHRTKLLASGLSPLISEGQSINNDQRAKAWAALDPATRTVAEWYRTRLGAIDGDGAPTPPADGALNQSAPTQANATDPLGFYSHAESVVAAKMGNRMNADDLGRMLTANGVKPDEMKYTGLGDFLATRGSEPVTRAEVQSHLADNKVQLGEITKSDNVKGPKLNFKRIPTRDGSYGTTAKESYADAKTGYEVHQKHGGDWVFSSPDGQVYPRTYDDQATAERAATSHNIEQGNKSNLTKFGQYQLPGGENYQEHLLTLPVGEPSNKLPKGWSVQDSGSDATDNQVSRGFGRYTVVNENGETLSRNNSRDSAILYARQNAGVHYNAKVDDTNNYHSSHWDEPNVVAHYRTNDRVSPSGEKIRHVEEVQSDWATSGRENGFVGQKPTDQANSARLAKEIEAAPNENVKAQLQTQKARIDKRIDTGSYDTPRAPFVEGAFHEPVMRRILRQAAEGGYDRISWTPGEDHVKRYGLQDHVDALTYDPDTETLQAKGLNGGRWQSISVPKGELAAHVGQDVAARLIEKPNEVISGDGLKVGKEGMTGFYDKIIPDYLNKFGKRFGAKVDTTEITHKDEQNQLSDDAAFTATPRDEENPDDSLWDVHSHTGEYITSHDSEQEAERDAEHRTSVLHKNYGTLTKTVPSMAINDAMRAHLLEQGNPLFQGEATDGDKRPVTATLQFDRYGVANIKYHKGANDSTPIHEESGHVMMNDIYRDADTPGGNGFTDGEREHLEGWAKPKNLDAWRSGRVVEENKPAHEKFANGAEKFFATGKAPTEILRRVFEKLGARIRDIYRNATGDSSPLSVKLTPQMHAVYGKLLGGDGAVEGAGGDKYAGSINTEKTGLDAAGNDSLRADVEKLGLGDKATHSLSSLRTSARTEGLSVDDLRKGTPGQVPAWWQPNAPKTAEGQAERAGQYVSRLHDLFTAARQAKDQAQSVYDADPSASHLADLDKTQQDAYVATVHRDALAHVAGVQLVAHKTVAEPFFGTGAGIKADDILAPSPKQSRAAADAGVSPKSRNYDSKPRQFANIDRSAVIAELQRLHQGGDTGESVPLNQMAVTKQTDTPEFKRWFGDSKVVDANGDPLVQHHSTYSPDNFTQFKNTGGDLGIHFGSLEQAEERAYNQIRNGGQGERYIPAYLSVKNPIDLYDDGKWDYPTVMDQILPGYRGVSKSDAVSFDDSVKGLSNAEKLPKLREFLESRGYDGFKYVNRGEAPGWTQALRDHDWEGADKIQNDYKGVSYAAFHPEQIKSAIGNSGAFDPNDANILHQSSPPSERGRLLANLGAYHIEGGNKTYVAFSKVMQDEAKAGGFAISEGDMTAAYRNARYMIGQQVVGGGGSPSSQTEFAQNIGSMLGKEGAADFANAAQAHPAVGPDAFDRFVRLGPAGVTTAENTAIRGEFTKALAEKAARGGATPAQAAAVSQATMELADARSEFNREQAKTRARNQAATAKATAGQLTPDEVFDRDTDKRYGGSTKTGDVFRDNLPDAVRAKLLSKTPLTADDEQAIFDAHKAARASRPAPQQGVTGDADAVVRKVVADGNKAANRGRLQEAAAAKRAAAQKVVLSPEDAFAKSQDSAYTADGAKAFSDIAGPDLMRKLAHGAEPNPEEEKVIVAAHEAAEAVRGPRPNGKTNVGRQAVRDVLTDLAQRQAQAEREAKAATPKAPNPGASFDKAINGKYGTVGARSFHNAIGDDLRSRLLSGGSLTAADEATIRRADAVAKAQRPASTPQEQDANAKTVSDIVKRGKMQATMTPLDAYTKSLSGRFGGHDGAKAFRAAVGDDVMQKIVDGTELTTAESRKVGDAYLNAVPKNAAKPLSANAAANKALNGAVSDTRDRLEAQRIASLKPKDRVREQLLKIAPTDADGNVDPKYLDRLNKELLPLAPDDTHAIANVLSKYSRSVLKNLQTAYRSGLLSGPQTLGKIGISHILYMAAEEAKRVPAAAADAAMSRVFGTERTVGGGDLLATGRAIGTAITKGAPEALHILRHGEASLALKGHNPYNAATGINSEPLTAGDSRIQPEYSSYLPGKAGDVVNAAVRAPLRAHSAFFHMMQTGLIDRGLSEWANLEATKQADPALKGRAKSDAIAKSAADLRLNPTQEGLDFAHNFAREQLFTNDNKISEGMSDVRKGIAARDKAKGTNFLPGFDAASTLAVPFNKVPVNVGGKAIEYGGGLATSAAYTAKAIKAGLFHDTVTPEQQRIWANSIGRGASGAGAMLLGSLIHRGIIKGANINPPDAKDHEWGSATGLGRDWQTSTVQPTMSPLYAGAYAADRAKANHRSFPNVADYAAGATRSVLLSAADNPYLRLNETLAPLFDAAVGRQDNPYTKGAPAYYRAAGGFAGSFVPTLAAETAAQFDPNHDVRNKGNADTSLFNYIMNSVKNRIPGERATLPAYPFPEASGLIPGLPSTPAKPR